MSRDEDLLDKKLLGRRNAKRLADREEWLALLIRQRKKHDAKIATLKEQIARLREI